MLDLIILMLAPLAHADTPVLHDTSPREAVDRAVAHGSSPAWDLDPMRPDQLISTPQAGLVGVPPTCQRAVATAAQLAKSVELATQLFQRRVWDGAEQHLRQARSELSCLVDEADAARVAQLHLMAGIVAHEQGNLDQAAEAFDRAHRFGGDPTNDNTLTWNNRLASPSHGGDAFQAAAARLASAADGTLRMAPGVDPGRLDLRVDGRSVPLSATDALKLPVGYHHIQVVSVGSKGRVVRTFEVDLDATHPIVVADPQGLTDLRLAPHAGGPALADFIRAAGIHGQAWVVTDTDVWTLDQTWTRVPQQRVEDPLIRRDRATARRTVGISTLVSGVIVSGLGAWGRSTVVGIPSWEETASAQTARVQQGRAWGALTIAGLGSIATGTTLLVTTPRTP